MVSVKTRNKLEARSGNLNARYKLYNTLKHHDLFRRLAIEQSAIPAWLAIQMDSEHLSVYFGTVEALDGNTEIPMRPDATSNYECLARNMPHGLDISHHKNTYELRSHSTRRDQTILSPIGKPARQIYLHLCCEGWQEFGPYGWLSFQDSLRAIVDEAGTVIAAWDGHTWRISTPEFQVYA